MDIAQNYFKNMLHRKISGLKEVSSLEQCQVILSFCTITSRAGTDIDAAMNLLNQVKASRPVIMVILHHTFDPEKIVSDSNNFIKISHKNTFAVDCLFYETGMLLDCPKNTDAIDKTAKYLNSENLTSYYCFNTDHGNQNLSTDQDAENCPLVNEEHSSLTCCQKTLLVVVPLFAVVSLIALILWLVKF